MLVLVALPGWVAAREIEPEPVQLLRNRLQQLNILTGTLIQKKEFKDLETTLTAQGRFMFVRGQGLYWGFTRPFPLEYYYSFNEQMLYSRAANTQDFTVIKAGRWVALLPSLVELDLSKLARAFTIDYIQVGEEVFITLSPKIRALKKRLEPIKIELREHVERLVVDSIGAEKTEWLFSEIIEDTGSIAPWVEPLGLPIETSPELDEPNRAKRSP